MGHEPGGGSGVHKITNFHLLLLAVGIRRHAGRILEQIVQNRSGPRCALEVLRRVFANLFNPVDDTRMDLGRGAVMGTRVRKQHLQIIGRSLSQSLQPLAFPNSKSDPSLSEILLGPLGMFTGQAAQSGPIGDPIDFHDELHLTFSLSMISVKPFKQPLPFFTLRASSLAC